MTTKTPPPDVEIIDLPRSGRRRVSLHRRSGDSSTRRWRPVRALALWPVGMEFLQACYSAGGALWMKARWRVWRLNSA
jgi:hypothetical protein